MSWKTTKVWIFFVAFASKVSSVNAFTANTLHTSARSDSFRSQSQRIARSSACSLVPSSSQPSTKSPSRLLSYASDTGAPSDYDREDLTSLVGGKGASTAVAAGTSEEEDSLIRDALKRELLLLSSVTNRGEYATTDEQNVLVDIVTQLEALNPTPDPARTFLFLTASPTSAGANVWWDLCLSSTQFFRSSPFFQSIRAASATNNDSLRAMVDTAFDIHDRATTAGRIGRVRQTVLRMDPTTPNTPTTPTTPTDTTTGDLPLQLLSEVDLEVGLLPGLPLRVKGTVVTKANIVQGTVTSDSFQMQIVSTRITNSNIPLINQVLDSTANVNSNSNWLEALLGRTDKQNLSIGELPVGQIYRIVLGSIPSIPNKTYYLDESMRITRDQDDNFFVFTRS